MGNTKSACAKFGAKTVYSAAAAHLSGDKSALGKVGITANNLGDANKIMADAYKLMSAIDQAGDLADVTISLAKLTGQGGPGRGQGRKPTPEADRTIPYAIRLTPAQIEKLGRLGGSAWVRGQIEEA